MMNATAKVAVVLQTTAFTFPPELVAHEAKLNRGGYASVI
jgi:hypothetical protein